MSAVPCGPLRPGWGRSRRLIGASKPNHIGDGMAGCRRFAELQIPPGADGLPMTPSTRVAMWSANPHQEACLPGAVLEVPKRQLSVVEEDLLIGPVLATRAGRTLRHPTDLAEAVPGGELRRPGPVKRPRTPRRNDIAQVAELRSTSTSSRLDNALTTDEPTPVARLSRCRNKPNLPPACSLVKTTSTDRPVRCRVHRIPRP